MHLYFQQHHIEFKFINWLCLPSWKWGVGRQSGAWIFDEITPQKFKSLYEFQIQCKKYLPFSF